MTGKDTVYDDIGQFEGSCRACYSPWVNYSIASNGDLRSVGVVFLGADLAHYLRISYFL